MGKPRMIILIRHAQSEGNKNREIHQMIPDHRVKLTDEGWHQAEEAGHRLRALLNPDDTLQFFTSPYRRTRETTEGILRTLTAPPSSDNPHSAPSPFSRSSIKVYEEPRLREQDFGNFQPCTAEMERMWQERADYGHFFYRIPNGESAADAYDRISGFNESLWRQIGESTFPSVCVLVTHGLMTRVFLMKWYHWSVEYFEDLRNVNHCEFVVMKQNMENGKYVLQNQMRTWSALKRQKAEEAAKQNRPGDPPRHPRRRNTLSHYLEPSPTSKNGLVSPGGIPSPSSQPRAQWGGCVGGCHHDHEQFPYRKFASAKTSAPSDNTTLKPAHPRSPTIQESPPTTQPNDTNPAPTPQHSRSLPLRPELYRLGRDAGGSASGAGTPTEGLSDDEYFPNTSEVQGKFLASALKKAKTPKRQATVEDIERWANESGMGRGKKADALGDEPDERGEESGDASGEQSGPEDVKASMARSKVEELDEEGFQTPEQDKVRKELEKELEDKKKEEQSIGGSVY
ncbi:phosphoglycerate mutase-like protein [Polychaeton citri CBS 116435]|uniref:Phosphoglycerate mutase-like protein n=1 Tax=Polychaeton citri CBS 116435 TaxID=1314669 RepID=A0A9P4Q9I6_9PEZI|nr:phosphoglycerate mutase-like protein [Polychaeton citri CBS 116435]